MKKIMVLILGVVSVALITGCQKKERAEAPMQQPMVSEQSSAVAPASASAIATEPVQTGMASPVATAVETTTTAVTQAATAAIDQTAALVEKPTPQQVQQALKNAGLYAGKVDGSLGPKTKKAIEEFQAANGLTSDGKVGPRTWAKLGAHLNGASAVATEPIMPMDASATGSTTNGASR